MKIINQSVEIMDELDGKAILEKLERCGRVCYKSEDKITEGSALKFVNALIQRGHESVLEHVSFSVRFITDRGVSHEIVRHRLASYSQESTRYCKYDGDVVFIRPIIQADIHQRKFFFTELEDDDYDTWKDACQDAEITYDQLRVNGVSPQNARSVLPNSLKTELVMTANLREWRHFLRLRTSEAAHPQMRALALSLLVKLVCKIPAVFDDIVDDVIK